MTAFCLLFASFFLAKARENSNLQVIFFDIGQGDASLIRTPFGQNILIDSGDGNKILMELGAVLPWWDRHIDLLVLSHPHSDHVGGMAEIMKRYDVAKIIYNGASHNSPEYLAWLEIVREKNTPILLIENEQRINLGEECYLDILFPRESFAGRKVKDLNETSIVLNLHYGKNAFLFTGDSGEEVELKILKNKDRLRANVLKVGHHGSDTSSSIDFLRAVQAEYAIIQVGKDNVFGLPDRRVVKRLGREGFEVWRNDLDGTISFESDGNKVWKN